MKINNFKLKKRHRKLVIPILLSTLFITSCNYGMLETVPFSLGDITSEDYYPPNITFINSLDSFNEYLSDTTIFRSELSDKFKEINSKYDTSYFEKKDLLSIIELATSGMVIGYKLESIEIIDNYWVVEINSIVKGGGKYVTCDEGGYFCYYISVTKDENIIGAKLTYYTKY